jgi:hypothetical protein
LYIINYIKPTGGFVRFNKNRMAKLAGLPQSRGSLNESRKRALLRRSRMLTESRKEEEELKALLGDDFLEGMDDEPVVDMADGEVVDDLSAFDMSALPELDDQMGLTGEMDDKYRGMETGYDPFFSGTFSSYDDELDVTTDMRSPFDEIESDISAYYEDEEPSEGEESFDDTDFLGESEKKKKDDEVEIDDEELKKEVRNIKRKRLNEARLKAVIEDELRDILSEMQYGSGWMYGNNKPKASRKGSITRGFKGLGFK